MFLRSGILFALASLLAFPVNTGTVEAGQRHYRHHHHHARHDHARNNHMLFRNKVAHRHGRRNVVKSAVVVNVINGGGFGYVGSSYGTYSGDVDISYSPGVGTWSYGTTSARARSRMSTSAGKVINVNSHGNDCRMETGVCVIRP